MSTALRRARRTWWWVAGTLTVYACCWLTGAHWAAWALVIGDVLLFGFEGILPTTPTAPKVAPEEAWDNGMQYGVRLARDVVAEYRKPYITLGEERGWDLARGQLVGALEELLDEVHVDEVARP